MKDEKATNNILFTNELLWLMRSLRAELLGTAVMTQLSGETCKKAKRSRVNIGFTRTA